MQQICMESACFGCAACAGICPRKCIAMVENTRGFRVPRIDENSCIHCGVCAKTCPVNQTLYESSIAYVIAAKNNDLDTRLASSSGGIFSMLSQQVLSVGGFVYGAKQFSAMDVRQVGITHPEEIADLRGSKYIPSDMLHCYHQVKRNLQDGFPVLFCGTPCQGYALQSYLGDAGSRLITVDFACHGVMSPLALRSYLHEQGFDEHEAIVNWRDKAQTGWRHFGISIHNGIQNKHQPAQVFDKTTLGSVFVANLLLRESCYACQRKAQHSAADITLGDYWGIENAFPELDDDQGVSVVIAHTEKGLALVNQIKKHITFVPSTFSQAAANNFGLRDAAHSDSKQEAVFSMLAAKGLTAVYRHYVHKTILQRGLGKLKRTALVLHRRLFRVQKTME